MPPTVGEIRPRAPGAPRVCGPQHNLPGHAKLLTHRRGGPLLFNVEATKFFGIDIASITAIELTARPRLDPPQFQSAPHQAIGNAQALADLNRAHLTVDVEVAEQFLTYHPLNLQWSTATRTGCLLQVGCLARRPDKTLCIRSRRPVAGRAWSAASSYPSQPLGSRQGPASSIRGSGLAIDPGRACLRSAIGSRYRLHWND